MVDLKEEFPEYNSQYLQQIEEYASDIINDERYLMHKKYIQHGSTSIYKHCIMVTCRCLQVASKKNDIDKKRLVRASLLHDYFKYDWHIYARENGLHKLHGIYHPTYAAENAIKDFNISKLEENAIRAHMWPLGFAFPKSKEAWILFWADKYCALNETCRLSSSGRATHS